MTSSVSFQRGELSPDFVPRLQDPVHRQRDRSAVPPEHRAGHQIQHLWDRHDPEPRLQQGLDGTGRELRGLSEGHILRLPDPRAGPRQHAAVHGPVRPADQHVQREDLSVPLVLDGRAGRHQHRQFTDVDSPSDVGGRPGEIRLETPLQRQTACRRRQGR